MRIQNRRMAPRSAQIVQYVFNATLICLRSFFILFKPGEMAFQGSNKVNASAELGTECSARRWKELSY